MKFKLVENINGGHENVSSNDILNEASNEIRRAYGNKLDNITNPKGQGKKYEKYFKFIAEYFKTDEKYVAHHIDGFHNNEGPGVVFLPEKLHSKIHNYILNTIENRFKSKSNYKQWLTVIADYKQAIMTLNTLNNNDLCVNKDDIGVMTDKLKQQLNSVPKDIRDLYNNELKLKSSTFTSELMNIKDGKCSNTELNAYKENIYTITYLETLMNETKFN